jgi:hypothetical protein
VAGNGQVETRRIQVEMWAAIEMSDSGCHTSRSRLEAVATATKSGLAVAPASAPVAVAVAVAVAPVEAPGARQRSDGLRTVAQVHAVPMHLQKRRVSSPWTNNGTERNPWVACLKSLKTGGQKQRTESGVRLAAVAAAAASQVPWTYRRCALGLCRDKRFGREIASRTAKRRRQAAF